MRTLLRISLAGIAFTALLPGLQATLGPESFYNGFPLGRGWVELLPPYNEHLTRDVGAFYLAFALLFAWAAVTLERALIVPLAVAWSVFSALHAVFHITHLDGFGTGDAIAQTAGLLAVIALPLARRGLRADGARAVLDLTLPSSPMVRAIAVALVTLLTPTAAFAAAPREAVIVEGASLAGVRLNSSAPRNDANDRVDQRPAGRVGEGAPGLLLRGHQLPVGGQRRRHRRRDPGRAHLPGPDDGHDGAALAHREGHRAGVDAVCAPARVREPRSWRARPAASTGSAAPAAATS